MKGFQITFFTELNRKHQGIAIHQWLIQLAQQLKLRGATVMHGVQGLDHLGHIHSAAFFELADQPVQVQFALTETELVQLLSKIEAAGEELFYVKVPAEFGVTGE
jgi:PII-like signaling protein